MKKQNRKAISSNKQMHDRFEIRHQLGSRLALHWRVKAKQLLSLGILNKIRDFKQKITFMVGILLFSKS